MRFLLSDVTHIMSCELMYVLTICSYGRINSFTRGWISMPVNGSFILTYSKRAPQTADPCCVRKETFAAQLYIQFPWKLIPNTSFKVLRMLCTFPGMTTWSSKYLPENDYMFRETAKTTLLAWWLPLEIQRDLNVVKWSLFHWNHDLICLIFSLPWCYLALCETLCKWEWLQWTFCDAFSNLSIHSFTTWASIYSMPAFCKTLGWALSNSTSICDVKSM